MMYSKETLIPLKPMMMALNPWIQKTLFRQEGRSKILISRSYISVASTVFLILASLLPYADMFLGLFINTNDIKMKRFPNLSTAMWSYSMCITPLLILIASRFKPYWFAYIVPVYVYTTMLCGFLFLDLNINIKSDWVFRLVTFTLSLILLFLASLIVKIGKVVRLKEDVMNEMIKNKTHG